MRNVFLVLTAVSLFTFESSASEIFFMTHSLQNQTYLDASGNLRGKEHGGKRAFNLELVREMMTSLGQPTKIDEVPFARGLKLAQAKPDYAMFNVSRTPAREKSVKWVGPLQVETDYLYEMKSTPSGAKTLEDAKQADSICVLNGGVHHTTLKNRNFSNLYTSTSYVRCFELLKKGRITLTPSASSTVAKKLSAAGIAESEINQTPVVVAKTGGYIAFSKNIPDSVIAQWQQAFDEIKRTGKYEELLKHYFEKEN